MKKKILIGGVILVAIIAIVVAAILIFKAPPMLTQERIEVSSITLTMHPGIEQETTTVLNQKADMYTVYALIAKTESRRNFSYGHEGAAHDPSYEIVITYKNGAQDRFFCAEEGTESDMILRCINPDEPIEKQKFVRGNCKGLNEHLKVWFE